VSGLRWFVVICNLTVVCSVQIMSKPAFVVEVSKGSSKKLAMHCVFPASDEYTPPAEHEQGDPYGQSAYMSNGALAHVVLTFCFDENVALNSML